MHVITAQTSGQPRHCEQVARVRPSSYLTSVLAHVPLLHLHSPPPQPPVVPFPLSYCGTLQSTASALQSPPSPPPFTPQACRTALKKEAKGSKFDVVLHDGAPNVGGAWSNEAYTQVWGRGGHFTSLHEGRGRGTINVRVEVTAARG